MNLVVVGTQWGDEGKGKIVDLLSEKADWIVRYAGGHNAGHTVALKESTIVLHLVPTGVLHPGKIGVIGNGVVIDPEALLSEISALASHGILVSNRLFISESAHLIMPYHKALDKASESRKGSQKIGTTGRGIGPAYSDKTARIGIRVVDLFDEVVFRQRLESNLTEMNRFLKEVYQVETFDLDAVYRDYVHYKDQIKPYVADTAWLIHQAIEAGKDVLFEGAQGTHLDVDMGTYPFVTSSSATAGGACTGTGIGPTQMNEVLGVTKAYTTRVGQGPFPSELTEEMGNALRQKGQEFGATTGRPRRCGWFDAVLVRYAVRVNGLTALAVTKVDILDGLSDLYICDGYEYQGKVFTEMPASLSVLQSCTPRLVRYSGWTESTAGISDYEKLPRNAKTYLDAISSQTRCRVDMISTGFRQKDTIILRNPFA
ncbi:MAG: adenylosuccinate synthase [Nitrospirota bacterium]